MLGMLDGVVDLFVVTTTPETAGSEYEFCIPHCRWHGLSRQPASIFTMIGMSDHVWVNEASGAENEPMPSEAQEFGPF
jgi:hypothetical protein